MPTLNDIQHEINNLFSAIEDMDDEQIEEHMPSLMSYADELATQEADKIDGITFALRQREATVKFLKDEEARIKARRMSAENAVRRFKEYMVVVFQTNGLQKIKGNSSTLFLRNSDRVVIDINPQDLPGMYVQQRIDWVPDKNAIKKAIKDGADVPGAHIETATTVAMR